jgi:lysophospholipase L1-like esterase
MSLALKLVLAPVLVAQAVRTRRRAPVLPEPAGPRHGRVGQGDAELRLLIAGDSSAAGVGVAHQDQALAGHLSRALHRHSARPVRWELHARSGLTTQQVFALLRTAEPPPADVAVVLSGVNDVIDLVPTRRAVQQRAALADWLLGEGRVRHVVFAPLPPVHRFPLLPEPLRRVMGDDARRHDAALGRWAASRGDVSHIAIDMNLEPEAMAEDGFHPGEPVYRICGEALAAHIAGL